MVLLVDFMTRVLDGIGIQTRDRITKYTDTEDLAVILVLLATTLAHLWFVQELMDPSALLS